MHYRMSGLLSRLQATAYFIFCPQLRRNRGGSDVWRWCRSHGVEPWCLPEIFHSLIWMINTGVKALSLLRRGLNARIGKKKKKKKYYTTAWIHQRFTVISFPNHCLTRLYFSLTYCPWKIQYHRQPFAPASAS